MTRDQAIGARASQACLAGRALPNLAPFIFLDAFGALYFVALKPFFDFFEARLTFALSDFGVFVLASAGAIAVRPNPATRSSALSFIYSYSRPVARKKTDTFSQNNRL